MAGGRPPEYDPEYIMQEMICWARLPDSLNINAFCHSIRPEIDPEYLRQLINKCPEFSRVYRIVKSYLAIRREEAYSDKILGESAYNKHLHVYDSFYKDANREEKIFDKSLEDGTKSEQVQQIENKFDDLLTQLKGLSRSKEKIDCNRTNNDTKS